jgi:rare lipoprotein A
MAGNYLSIRIHPSLPSPSLPSYLLIICLIFLTSCSSGRYETRPLPPAAAVPGKATAIASWYGAEFHGRPTSSGEIFNMNERTAAHKSYPFGTRLSVVNPENGLSTVVTVNDRGPFVEGRDIDLSYQAAKDIGLIGPGTGRVILEYAGRSEGYVKTVGYAKSYGGGPFTIQAGSFEDPVNAIRLKKALELEYNGVYIMDADINGKTLYRVRLGKFPSKKEAYKEAKRLADEGYSALIAAYEEKI